MASISSSLQIWFFVSHLTNEVCCQGYISQTLQEPIAVSVCLSVGRFPGASVCTDQKIAPIMPLAIDPDNVRNGERWQALPVRCSGAGIASLTGPLILAAEGAAQRFCILAGGQRKLAGLGCHLVVFLSWLRGTG